MKYSDGRNVNVGDRVEISNRGSGVVVCSFDDDSYSASFIKNEWAHLGCGVLIKLENDDLIHYQESDCDLLYKNMGW